MKLKKLWLVALAAITLVGCTKEVIVEVPTPGSGGGTEEVGDTYVKFSLDANMVKTRALPDDHDGLGPTTAENLIYNYALFIFKSNGMLEATLIGKSPNLGSPISPTPTADGNMLTFVKDENSTLTWNDAGDAIRISAGSKTFFAVVNAPNEFVTDQGSFINNPTLTLDELKEITFTLNGKLNKIVGAYSNGNVSLTNPVGSGENENRGFMMTSIIADGQSDSFRRMTLLEQEEDDAPYEVTVIVGRAMAKVSLASDLKSYDDITTANAIDINQQYGVLEPLEYKIINNPNEMNVALLTRSGIVVTPYMGETTVNTANYFVSNNSSHVTEGYYIPVSKGPNDITFNYCIENANNKPKYGNATIALIKGHYTPLTGDVGRATILDDDFNDDVLGEKQTFFRIWIDGYTDANGDPQGNVYADEYFTVEPDLDLYRQYRTTENIQPVIPASVELEVVEYENGLCYYYLALYDNASADPYTVVRNSYYRIDIKSVEGPGYPEKPGEPGEPGGPDKPGPEVPIEAQSNIKAQIEVADWYPVNQEGNL